MEQEQYSEDQLKFVTRGVVSEDTQRAFTDVYWRRSTYLKVIVVIVAALLCFTVWFLTHGEWFNAILGLVLIVGLIAAFQVSRNRAVRVYEQRHTGTKGANAAEYMTGYTDDFVYTENRENGTCAGVPYSGIRCYYQTDQYLFLLTNGSTFVETFFDHLSKEEQKELLAFLKQKGVKKK